MANVLVTDMLVNALSNQLPVCHINVNVSITLVDHFAINAVPCTTKNYGDQENSSLLMLVNDVNVLDTLMSVFSIHKLNLNGKVSILMENIKEVVSA